MRVIAGKYKSRILKDPKGNRTHPMSEKIRGAMFNSLGDIEGKTFLDAFAGTGAVGIEALSRGVSFVNAVEINPDSFEILKENRNRVTDEESMQVHRANVKTWLKNQDKMFDIIVADPPYDAVGMNAIDTCAEYLAKDGILILSLPVAENVEFKKLKLIDTKIFGNAKLVYYRY